VVALAIGVAAVIVLAVVVIPTLLPSHLSGNEESALASLQALNSACSTYAMMYGGYPKSLANLGPGASVGATTAALVDSGLASGSKDGYVFRYAPGATGISGNVLSYTITANPATPNSGRRRFFTDQSGVVRAQVGAAADASSSPIG
jgi:type II secretory pathway pseudopilin PulG